MSVPDEDRTPGHHLAPEERDPEAPEADAAEQATLPIRPSAAVEVHRGLEVTSTTPLEQSRVVELDDDYR